MSGTVIPVTVSGWYECQNGDVEDAIREVRVDLQDLADALGTVEEAARGER